MVNKLNQLLLFSYSVVWKIPLDLNVALYTLEEWIQYKLIDYVWIREWIDSRAVRMNFKEVDADSTTN